jgi:hypothetical protein
MPAAERDRLADGRDRVADRRDVLAETRDALAVEQDVDGRRPVAPRRSARGERSADRADLRASGNRAAQILNSAATSGSPAASVERLQPTTGRSPRSTRQAPSRTAPSMAKTGRL